MSAVSRGGNRARAAFRSTGDKVQIFKCFYKLISIKRFAQEGSRTQLHNPFVSLGLDITGDDDHHALVVFVANFLQYIDEGFYEGTIKKLA